MPRVKGRGFTLIELLIVIAIIAILASVALISFSGINKNSRDGRRKADLALIQSALEQYHADQNFYPPYIQSLTNYKLTDPAIQITNATGRTGITVTKTYLNKLPVDPKNEETYVYAYAGLPNSNVRIGVDTTICNNTSGNYCTSYCLYALTESTVSGTISTPCVGSVPGTSFNYAVTPP